MIWKPPRRAIITGSRHWDCYPCLKRILDDLHATVPFEEFAVGDCPRGADEHLLRWAYDHDDVGLTVFSAEWLKNGKAGGPLRNQRMVDEFKHNLCIAFFWGPHAGCKGTSDCVRRAKEAGHATIIEVNHRHEPCL